MAPSAYIEARYTTGDELTRVIVDDQPYMPFLEANPADEESIKHVAGCLFDSPVTEVTPVSGGITNALFRIKLPEKYLLVRVFGAEGMIDRDIENATFAALAKAGVAPKYYGRFGNGRVEEWLVDNYKALEVPQLSDPVISRQISIQMARLHALFKVPKHLQQHHDAAKPSLWTQLYAWMKQALESKFQNENDANRALSLNLDSVQKELDWLNEQVPKDARVAFCHNDLLAANIMYNQKEIQLIDFEYGGINFCAFDIANHFNEFAGGTVDGVPNYAWFPSLSQQKAFCQTYVETRNALEKAEGELQKETDDLFKEVHAFVLVNHLYWGLWAVNQAASEGCSDFDYLLYAKNRMVQYYRSKSDE